MSGLWSEEKENTEANYAKGYNCNFTDVLPSGTFCSGSIFLLRWVVSYL